ncbi:MAG: HIT family protein [Candidatus Nanoarchaeia archaeon]
MVCEMCNALNEKYRLVKESEFSFCIINREPLKQGHVMVLPKRHVAKLDDLEPNEAKDLLDLCSRLKDKLKEKYNEDPLIMLNTGKHSSQEHIHFHIWPSKGMLRELVSSFEGIPKRVISG